MTACTRKDNPPTAMCWRQQRKRHSVLETTPSQKQFIGYICYNSQQRILHVHAVNTKHKHCLQTHQLLRFKILSLQSQYLLSLLLFVAEIHSFNTKNKLNLHPPLSKLTVFQRGPYYSGIKAFNNLPSYIKNLLQTKKQFKHALKEFLHFHSFYSLNEFYNYNRT